MEFPSFKCFLLCLVISLSGAAVSLAGAVLAAELEVAEDVSGSTIPEPTVVGLVGLVGVMLMIRRRR